MEYYRCVLVSVSAWLLSTLRAGLAGTAPVTPMANGTLLPDANATSPSGYECFTSLRDCAESCLCAMCTCGFDDDGRCYTRAGHFVCLQPDLRLTGAAASTKRLVPLVASGVLLGAAAAAFLVSIAVACFLWRAARRRRMQQEMCEYATLADGNRDGAEPVLVANK